MLPIYIVCHASCEPSSYLCAYFDKNNILYKKINALNNDLNSLDITAVAGLVFMGGPYSVYENRPWLKDELQLLQKAIDADTLIMGVCFGSQLISKALGAQVYKAEQMELGWHMIATDTERLDHLHPLKLKKNIEVFEWHEDIFSIPEGAIPIFSGTNHENQGYLSGNILVMQFHLEMTEQMVDEWLKKYHWCLPGPSQSVQSPEQITQDLHKHLNDLHKQADTIYGWWLNLKQLKTEEKKG